MMKNPTSESKAVVYTTTKETFEKVRTDPKTIPDVATVESGTTPGRIALSLTTGSVLQVVNSEGESEFWRVVETDSLESGAFRHVLKKQAIPVQSPPIMTPPDSFSKSPASFQERAIVLAGRYGVAGGIFMLGWHLHAQVNERKPFWEEGHLLYGFVRSPESQEVTARWLMIAGIASWGIARYRVFEK